MFWWNPLHIHQLYLFFQIKYIEYLPPKYNCSFTFLTRFNRISVNIIDSLVFLKEFWFHTFLSNWSLLLFLYPDKIYLKSPQNTIDSLILNWKSLFIHPYLWFLHALFCNNEVQLHTHRSKYQWFLFIHHLLSFRECNSAAYIHYNVIDSFLFDEILFNIHYY